MHYYQFNIGDYLSHTGHLDLLEDLAYRRMIEWCYLHESPLPFDVKQIAKKIRMQEHCDCITSVLQEFFCDNDDGWFNDRVAKELKSYKALSTKRKKAANKRWANTGKASKGDASALQVESKSNAKHEPLTNNHKPLTKENKTTPVKPKYDECDEDFANWCLLEIQKVIPDFKVKSIDSWAKTARDIRVLDEIDMNEAGRVWRWCVNDSFERANVQSMTKLRKRYMNLREKAKGNSNETNQRSSTARPDTSAAGRVRQNVAAGIAAAEREIAEIDRHQEALAANEQPLRLQMDEGIR